MKLIFVPSAVKALRKMPRKDADALRAKLATMSAAPFSTYPWAKRLTSSAYYRVRQSDWRAVYRIDREAGLVEVIKIGSRREIYE